MTDPISFTDVSPRFALPFLFAGQAQKEFFVNEAFARLDALLHPSVLGESDAPPADPVDGDCWIVGPAGEGEWAGRADCLACRQPGQWTYLTPRPGMRVFDSLAEQLVIYTDTWRRCPTPPLPTGGATVDAEARDAIATLIEALKVAGIFAA